MNVRSRLSVAGSVAVLLALSALWPVFEGLGWLPRAMGAVGAVALGAAVARRLGAPVLQPLLPLLTLLVYLVLAFASSTLHHGLLPGADTVTAFRTLLTTAGEDLAQYAAPAPSTTALVLLVAGGVGLVAVAVDLLASVVQRPAVAGLPLLALFAVPSAVLPGGLGWVPFALGAAGWLGMLLVEGRDQAVRWGTPLRSAAGGDLDGLGRVGRRIGGAALGVAVLVPVLVPGLDGRLFEGSGGGGGDGSSSRSVTTYNPMTRLRGELTLPDPVDVLRYTTDDDRPDYLRLTTLGVYDGAGWRQSVLRGNLRDDGVDDPIPAGPGRALAQSRRVTAEVQIETLEAFWLPAPATPSQVEVDGPWMWDPGSESVFATRADTGDVDSYTVTSSRVLPDPGLMGSGDAPVPPQVEPFATPIDATPEVRRVTEEAIAGQTTDYGRAMALQGFFRNDANGFVYDEETTSGGSPDALEDFLTERRGFCEQYASAMAAMLRLAGVPSRVAVGFTAGRQVGDGEYLVTTDQAHAWPEAWFDGAGWVRFEPTPSQDGIRPPVFAGPPTAAQTDPGREISPALPNTAPTGPGADLPSERSDRAGDLGVAPEQAEDGAAGGGSAVPARAAGVAAGTLGLLAVPTLLHALRRRQRWRTPTASRAWEQLREDATDGGFEWPDAATPRAAAASLLQRAALPEPAAQAVGRLTAAVERERYAPARADAGAPGGAVGPAGGGLAADCALVRRALRARLSRSQRWRAVLLRPATLRRAGSWTGSRLADLRDRVDAVVTAAGARVRRADSALAARVRRRSA